MEQKKPQRHNEEPARIEYVDFLKVLALFCIFLAHVGPPEWVIALRCFDVPLMVILSAMLGERSYARKKALSSSPAGYYLSRIRRIVVPTWLFLLIYFLIQFLLTREAHPSKYYLASFLLTRYGIGYVWIMLIYLYCALLIPLFSRWKLSVRGIIIVLAACVLYEVMYFFGIGRDIKLIDTTVFYLVPYGALTFLGCNYSRMSEKARRLIAVGSLAVLAGLAIYYRVTGGAWLSFQETKYPPRLYFLSYGVFCSFTLMMVCEKHPLRLFSHPAVRFLSSHSMWLYLWHILVLAVYEKLRLPEIWVLQWAVVSALAILMVLAVNACLDKLEKRRRIPLLSFFRG